MIHCSWNAEFGGKMGGVFPYQILIHIKKQDRKVGLPEWQSKELSRDL